jgi:hypothetical protein
VSASVQISCTDEHVRKYLEAQDVEGVFTVLLSKIVAAQPKGASLWPFVAAFCASKATTVASDPIPTTPSPRLLDAPSSPPLPLLDSVVPLSASHSLTATASLNALGSAAPGAAELELVMWFLERRVRYASLVQDVGPEQLHTLAAERGGSCSADQLRLIELDVRRLRAAAAINTAASPPRVTAAGAVSSSSSSPVPSGGTMRRGRDFLAFSIQAKSLTFRDGVAVLDDGAAEVASARETLVKAFINQQRRKLDESRPSANRSLKFSVTKRDDKGLFVVLFNDDIGPPLRFARSYKQFALLYARLLEVFPTVAKLPSGSDLVGLSDRDVCQALAHWLNSVETLPYALRRVPHEMFLDTYVDDGWRSTALVSTADLAETWQWVGDSVDRAVMVAARSSAVSPRKLSDESTLRKQSDETTLRKQSSEEEATNSAVVSPGDAAATALSSSSSSTLSSPSKRKKIKKKRADKAAVTLPITVDTSSFFVELGRVGTPPAAARSACGNTVNALRVRPCVVGDDEHGATSAVAAAATDDAADAFDVDIRKLLADESREEFELEQRELGEPVFAKHFIFAEHETWIVSSRDGAVESILSLSSVPRNSTHRAILRTKKTDLRIEVSVGNQTMAPKDRARIALTVAERFEQDRAVAVSSDELDEGEDMGVLLAKSGAKSPRSLVRRGARAATTTSLQVDAASPTVQDKKLRKVPNEQVDDILLEWDTKFVSKTFKFGVLRVLPGQLHDENAIYANRDAGGAFGDFLALLGDSVLLKEHRRFRGGLDCKGDDTTGTHSVFATHRSLEIMFHVAPLLPFFEHDVQQVERKRHIGNDVVVVVFNESGEPFDPSVLTSHFNHVFCVVVPQPLSPDGADAAQRTYRVAFASKLGVRPFGPFLSHPPIWQHGARFRDFLLTKLVNGERAAMFAPEFRGIALRTRGELLARITSSAAEAPATGLLNRSATGTLKFGSMRRNSRAPANLQK